MQASQASPASPARVDVLIIGAGISGIGAAVHLQQRCPNKSFVLVDRRQQVGGTWDLFRYPGVRSDSDMYTLGFRFKPWTKEKAIASGSLIRSYLEETVDEYTLRDKILFDHKVVRSSWSLADAQWTVQLTTGPANETRTITAKFIFMCGGYYSYDAGYRPHFVGEEQFTGTIVHPQHWPEHLDYRDKRVVVIGSGATAVTIVPAMVKEGAAHVTMLQRSPTYMVNRPSADRMANSLRKVVPDKAAYATVRWRNVLSGIFFFNLARKRPDKVKAKLLEGISAELGVSEEVTKNFTPSYNPWDQRLCLVPDGDFFQAMRDNKAEVVTAHIDRFTPQGIVLDDGRELPADVIVTATGLNLQMLAGMETVVDGVTVEPGDTVLHKGIMLSGIPNLAMWFGYTNASWTLKADLTSEYACRLLNHLDTTNTTIVTAVADPAMETETFVDFSSGYFARSQHLLPKQGPNVPWRLNQNYFKDLRLLRKGSVTDPALHFTRSPTRRGIVEDRVEVPV